MTEDTSAINILRTAGFILTLLLWVIMANYRFNHKIDLIVAAGAILGIPISWIGRKITDACPTIPHTVLVTTITHYTLMILFGSSLIKAIRVSQYWPIWIIPLPVGIGLLLMIAAGIIVAMTVAELAAEGLGAPFAIALSEQVAKKGMYAWTRNPMVLSLLIFLFSLGLVLRSLFFMVWLILLFMPALLTFVKVFEERELEIRFGQAYRDYKSRTPLLWPRKPKP